MVRACSLASSSKGNCILICGDQTNLFVDIGIGIKDVEAKLMVLGVEPKSITGILITHEHSDHIKGVSAFSRKYNTKIYVHSDDYVAVTSRLDRVPMDNVIAFNNAPFVLGEFHITNFKLPHDAKCCVGYSIQKDENKISICTDLGHTTKEIVRNLYGSKLVYLESNYDDKMLKANVKYTTALKNRIAGSYGHLSNKDCSTVVSELACNNVKQVVLSHLSEENNTPELCYESMKSSLMNMGVIVGTHIMVDVASARNIGTLFTLK